MLRKRISQFGSVVLSLSLILSASPSLAQLRPDERATWDRTLRVAVLSDITANIPKRTSFFANPLPLADKLLDKPTDSLENLIGLHRTAELGMVETLKSALDAGFGETYAEPEKKVSPDLTFPKDVPADASRSISRLVQGIASTNAQIKLALAKLSLEERRELIESLPMLGLGKAAYKVEFVTRPPSSPSRVFSLLAKVDLAKIRSAAVAFASQVEVEIPILRKVARSGAKIKSATLLAGGIKVAIGGTGDDVHAERDVHLCIDFGGSNRYTGRYGAGIGYTSFLADFGNGTRAEAGDATLGTGILGVGIARFDGAQNILRAGTATFGCGLAGVGILKFERATSIEGRALTLGTGFAGIGLVVAGRESDRLRCAHRGLGVGLPQGIGWVVNLGGDDSYFGTSSQSLKGRSGRVRSDSVGFSGGIGTVGAPFAGGIGLVSDLGGDDHYEAGDRSLSFAEFGGATSLFDEAGDDSYQGGENSIATSNEEASAYLHDLAGSDLYLAPDGNSIVSAGESSNAILFDRAGDDRYIGSPSLVKTVSPFSTEILFDAKGANLLTFPFPETSFGTVPGLSIWHLAGGPNMFGSGISEALEVRTSDGSITAITGDGSSEPNISEPSPLAGSTDELWETALDPFSAQSPRAVRGLIAVGKGTLSYWNSDRLSKLALDDLSVIALVVRQTQGSLPPLSESASNEVKRAWVYANAVTQQESEAFSKALGELQAGDLDVPLVLRSVAAVGKPRSSETIAPLAIQPNPAVSRWAARALLQGLQRQTDSGSLATFEALLKSPDLLTRRIACRYFTSAPTKGVEIGKRMISSNSIQEATTGIELLSAIGTPEALRFAATGLNLTDPVAKITAMHAIRGRVPEAYRSRVLELARDQDPIVSSVAKSLTWNGKE